MRPLPFLEFNDASDAVALRPQMAEVHQSIGKIDFARIHTTRSSPGTSLLSDDRPISFRWGINGSPANRRTYFGYVAGTGASADRNSMARLVSGLDVRIMGAAERLRDKKHRTWNNVTIPFIVEQITKEHHLNLVIDEHLVKWERLAQDGVSDWTFIVSLAKKVGWWVWLDGTTLYVLDPDRIVTRFEPIGLDLTSNLGPMNQRTDDSALLGSRRVVERTARYTDQRSGVIHHFSSADRVPVTGSSVGTSTLTEELVVEEKSLAEAQAAFEGVVKEASWYIDRKVLVHGRVDLRPLQPVLVRSPRMPRDGKVIPDPGWEQYDGAWIIKETRHHLTFHQDGAFRTELHLVRDARGDLNSRQRRAMPTSFDSQPPTRLLNNQWVAAWRA